MKIFGWGIGALFFAAAPAALAAIQVDGVTVTPNPASFSGNNAPQIEIAVIVNRGQTDMQACHVLVEPGDGSAPVRLSFLRGDERKSVRYAYATPGSYTVRAIAAYGCSGTRTVNVAVYGPSHPAPAADRSGATAQSAPQGGCPAGWWVVPESVQGARYTCRPNLPSVALKCGAGTSYFSENGIIGCR